MKVVEALERCGGVSDARTLVAFTSRRQVTLALESGDVERTARGRYALPGADEAIRAAHRLSGVVSGSSAAQTHGWELKRPPARPSITVPAKRRVSPARREGVDLHWRDVPDAHVWDHVLRPGPAVVDCARTLPFDEALAVADSALRHRAVTQAELLRLASEVRTTGRASVLRVTREASALAANPFESVLRAISLDVPGLRLRPQVVIQGRGWRGRPDLVDQRLGLVVEAESFEFHGLRRALRRDCERYTALVLLGWTVVRFAWEHVMFDPTYVSGCLAQAVDRAEGQETRPDLPRFRA